MVTLRWGSEKRSVNQKAVLAQMHRPDEKQQRALCREPKARTKGRGGRRLEEGQEDIPFRVPEPEFHPEVHAELLKGQLTFNKAHSGYSVEETGGQEMREKAAAMVQVREDRDAEERGDLRNV